MSNLIICDPGQLGQCLADHAISPFPSLLDTVLQQAMHVSSLLPRNDLPLPLLSVTKR
jgi:hypothetical protein